MNIPELLLPVGNFDCLKAAVQNGADAVYLGASNFNARNSATNFDYEELERAIDYAHLRNVKVHLTLNTLIKNEEFEEAIKLAKLGTADDYKPSIEGAEVNFNQSFIVAKKEVSGTDVKYKYYVRLIETKNSKNYGIELEEVNSLSKDSYKTNIDSITIPPTATSLNELVSTLGCTTVNYPA